MAKNMVDMEVVGVAWFTRYLIRIIHLHVGSSACTDFILIVNDSSVILYRSLFSNLLYV